MSKPYNEVVKLAKYKLMGHGDRRIKMLMDSLDHLSPDTPADTYGTGIVINDFEEEIATLLGKEKAVFFPSGTMAQQIAMRIWCDKKELKRVAYHPLCHLEIHEKDGLKVLHHIESTLLGNADRLFTIEDLKGIKHPIACLLIELPQREIGGQLPSWDELVELSAYCKAEGIKLHLDGARLFETLPYYNKTAMEVGSLFDSVYISFYKGLGGIAGAVLAGGADFIEESKTWKRRHGGDLISLYPYIINAKHAINHRMDKMGQYWKHAIYTAEQMNNIEGIKTIPQVPVCNMFHVYFDTSKEMVEGILQQIIEEHDLAMLTNLKEIDDSHCKAELSFGDSFGLIPPELLSAAFHKLDLELKAARKSKM